MDLTIQAAKNCDRVLKNPAAKCLVRGFGDNSVDLELRFWIADPANGVSNIKSMVYLEIPGTLRVWTSLAVTLLIALMM